VLAPYPGATPEQIEALVARPIEQELRTIAEIDVLESTSRQGIAVLSLELSDAVTNVTPVWSHVRDKLSDVAPSLPEGVQTPELLDDRGYAFSIVAALRWTLDTPPNPQLMERYAERLEDQLRQVAGTEYTLGPLQSVIAVLLLMFAVWVLLKIVALLSVLSMFFGSVAAIGQTNIKRLMAYSSIGHMGFALIGLAAGTQAGVASLLIYMAIYVVMNVGTFAFILNMERDGRPITDIGALNQYSTVAPGRAFALAILMFSMAGIPPMLGFFSKYYVFAAAVDAGLIPLAILGVVASVISAFYYLRIVKLMYFGEDIDPLTGRMPLAHGIALTASAVVLLLGSFVQMFGVETLAVQAAASLFN
jgi:hypothetical protein